MPSLAETSSRYELREKKLNMNRIASKARKGFDWTVFIIQGLLLICFLAFVDYSDEPTGADAVTPTNSSRQMQVFGMFFSDVHLMVFVGFGFLVSFLRSETYSAVGFGLMLGATALMWHLVVGEFLQQVWDADWTDSTTIEESFTMFRLSMDKLISADLAAAAVLISFGAVAGKATPTQLLWMAFYEVIFFSVNELVATKTLKVIDTGGSMFVHTFAAFFGLGVSRMITPRNIASDERDMDNRSTYHTDLFAMFGTIILWCFWPSFNAALVATTGVPGAQSRVIVNTILSLSASCVAAFVVSNVMRDQRFDMVDVQNASLAGGVAMGSANLVVQPFGAILIGLVAGTVSVIGFVALSDLLWRKLGIHDTTGVNNVHGLPGIVGGLAGAIAAASAGDLVYGDDVGLVFPARVSEGRTNVEQGGYQAAALAVSIAIGLGGGLLVGLLLRSKFFYKKRVLFTDKPYWEVPDEETPMYFASGVVEESVSAVEMA